MRLGAGAACARCFGLAIGLLALAACSGSTGSATPPPERGDGGPAKPPGEEKAPTCAVAKDIELGSAQAGEPAIAASGGKLAAVWTEQGQGLRVAVYDTDGKQTGTATIPVGTDNTMPAVAAAPDGSFVVAWAEPGAVRGVTIGPDGRTGGDVVTIAQPQGEDVRTTVGANAIAWNDAAGVTVGDLTSMALGGTATVADAREPSLAGTRESRALVFATQSKIGFARLASPISSVMPMMLGGDGVVGRVPRASPANQGFYVTWEDDSAGADKESVMLTFVNAQGQQHEVKVPSTDDSANFPDVTAVRGYAAVVYYQFRDGPPAVYLSLYGQDLSRAGDDVRISDKGAHLARVASVNDTLGVVYAMKDGPAHLALVSCR
jgi:hypothetical protein